MSALICGILLINCVSTYLLLRRNAGVVFLIQAWWLGWLGMAHLSITGIFPPSMFTTSLVIGSVCGITLGCAAHAYLSTILQAIPSFIPRTKYKSLLSEKRMTWILCCISLPFTLFFFGRFVWLIQHELTLSVYRAKVFGIGAPYPLLFKYSAVISFDWFVIQPVNLAALFLGSAVTLVTGRWRLFILAATMVLMHDIMMGGRFGIHYVIMFGLYTVVAAACANRNVYIQFMRFGIPIFLLLFLSILIISSVRLPGTKRTLAEVKNTTLRQLIDYHTVSFAILDHDIHTKDSMLHNPSYGRSSLGPLDRLFMRILSLVGIHKTAQSDWNGAALHENRLIGRDERGNPIHYNAFGSIFYSLFRDGGLAMCLLSSILFGFLLARFSVGLDFKNLYGLTLLASLFFIGIYGIFQPVLESPAYLAILLNIITFRSPAKRIGEVTSV